ncbi:MAG: hypothetical protein M3377_02090 [Actinomycetota bacterium]|nr:hypothetical protein [Actinomycetota bacterium]
MTPRATFWLATAAALVSAVALPVALVAAIRAGEQDAAPPAEHAGMQMPGDAMARHWRRRR